MSKCGLNIHNETASILNAIPLDGDNSVIAEFMKSNPLTIATTNFDKLAEELSGGEKCLSMAPGLPIPRSQSMTKVYHIHGSIDFPERMVLTSEDYFKFMNTETYFSKKLSTILHENTVVILGYSLGDTNLKSILNGYKGFMREHMIAGNIFFVTRSAITQRVKDYYAMCFGIRVIHQRSLQDFFKAISAALPEAEKRAQKTLETLKDVLDGKVFAQHYIKTERSFFEIISSVGAYGCSINDTRVVKIIGRVIKDKITLTHESGAWEQYEHLAKWLVYLASVLDITASSIKKVYLDAVKTSMGSMSKEKELGRSWQAFGSWKSGWAGILLPNRIMIRDFMVENRTNLDSLYIVELG